MLMVSGFINPSVVCRSHVNHESIELYERNQTLLYCTENNTWVRGNTISTSSVEHSSFPMVKTLYT